MKLLSILFLLCQSQPVVNQAASEPLAKIMFEVSTFEPEAIDPLIVAMQQADQDNKIVYLRINTFGGSVEGMFKLSQAMEQLHQPITCVNDTKAMSAGAFLLEEPGCSKRLATKRAMFLFHEASSAADGNEHSLQKTEKILHTLDEVLINQVAGRIGMSEKEFRNRIYNQEWVFGYEEALKYHVIDGIVDPKDLPELQPVAVQKNLLQQLLGE